MSRLDEAFELYDAYRNVKHDAPPHWSALSQADRDVWIELATRVYTRPAAIRCAAKNCPQTATVVLCALHADLLATVTFSPTARPTSRAKHQQENDTDGQIEARDRDSRRT